jgi:hypothetical protein
VAEQHGRSRTLTLLVVGAVVLGITGLAGSQLLPNRNPASAGTPAAVPVQTTTITRTNLATTLSVEGKLGYGTERPVKAGADGEVTWLPKSNRTVSRGEQLFRVNDQPVMLFYGRTPLFRALDRTGLVGRDVKVVADNLRALGYSIGEQPAVGTMVRQAPIDTSTGTGGDDGGDSADDDSADDDSRSGGDKGDAGGDVPPTGTSDRSRSAKRVRVRVRPGDAVLTSSLRAAIKRWQGDIGATPTGVLEHGAVVVRAQRLRISAVSGQLGDPADGPLISVTRTTKVVTVSVKAAELESVRGSKKVTVTLPSGDPTSGRVGSISRVVATPDGQDTEPSSTATITLDHPSTIRHLDSASVQVQFTTEARKGVLAVPVGALLALREGGYALQVQGGNLLPVTVGLFAKGMVEVSGTGVKEGITVVTTS